MTDITPSPWAQLTPEQLAENERIDAIQQAEDVKADELADSRYNSSHDYDVLECSTCGKTDLDVVERSDPYMVEIHNDYTSVPLCDNCHWNSAADV